MDQKEYVWIYVRFVTRDQVWWISSRLVRRVTALQIINAFFAAVPHAQPSISWAETMNTTTFSKVKA